MNFLDRNGSYVLVMGRVRKIRVSGGSGFLVFQKSGFRAGRVFDVSVRAGCQGSGFGFKIKLFFLSYRGIRGKGQGGGPGRGDFGTTPLKVTSLPFEIFIP